jgi:hypothetical protein
MYISLAECRATGIEEWSDAREPHGNDNEGDVARINALTGAGADLDYAAMTNRRTASYPAGAGVGNAFQNRAGAVLPPPALSTRG